MKTVIVLAGVVATGFVLGGCRDNEQGRPLAYDKGHYAGKPDAALSEEARRSIMNRVQHQSGLDSASSGTSAISGVSPSADVRPPAPQNE